MEKVVNIYGESYITKIIAALIEYPPHQIREYIFDIFHSALEYTKDYAIKWFTAALINVCDLCKMY